MPLFKMDSSKATPREALNYVTRKDKAIAVKTINLFGDTIDDYEKQFKDIAEYFDKDTGYDARKYYHFKLSPDPKDNITPEAMMDFATEMVEKHFSEYQCVIGIHKDNGVVHAHMVVNAVSSLTGKKINLRNEEYAAVKDSANEIGKKYGLSSLNFRKKPRVKRSNKEIQMMRKGKKPRNEQIREVITEAMNEAVSLEDYKAKVERYKIQIVRDGKDFSYLHPEAKQAVRGGTLGADFTKEAIIDAINGRNRTQPEAAPQSLHEGIARAEEGLRQLDGLYRISGQAVTDTAAIRSYLNDGEGGNPEGDGCRPGGHSPMDKGRRQENPVGSQGNRTANQEGSGKVQDRGDESHRQENVGAEIAGGRERSQEQENAGRRPDGLERVKSGAENDTCGREELQKSNFKRPSHDDYYYGK
ncbi:MAG: relaxase/mobilization nuclease domain-containing protein [Clostridia bacterium]|nr:relaxase/mobilization nuclease domain-containing protein [Clostridia bacterium]